MFFRFEPSAPGRLQVDTVGSDYDTVLSIFTRRGGRVERLGCNDDRFDLDSGLRFQAEAGVVYYFMVATCCGSGANVGGGALTITVTEVEDVALEAAFELGSGSTDALTGMLTLSGTATCSERSVLYPEAIVRQVRNQIFVARGYLFTGIVCTPGDSVAWSALVESETGIAFGPGQASVTVTQYSFATDGFREYLPLPSGKTVMTFS